MRELLITDIFDILEKNYDLDTEERVLIERNEKMTDIIEKKSRHYIAHFPGSDLSNRWDLTTSYDYSDLIQTMAIKEGVNLYKTMRGFEIESYYGTRCESLFLYPITEKQAHDLGETLDASDFDTSIVIDAIIAQYVY